MTVEEAANVLRLNASAVYDLIRRDVLPACLIGRSLRVSERALTAFVEI